MNEITNTPSVGDTVSRLEAQAGNKEIKPYAIAESAAQAYTKDNLTTPADKNFDSHKPQPTPQNGEGRGNACVKNDGFIVCGPLVGYQRPETPNPVAITQNHLDLSVRPSPAQLPSEPLSQTRENLKPPGQKAGS